LRLASRGPILILIDAQTVNEIVEANHEGADECLVKPVNPTVLVVKAMAWLSHGQRRARLSTLLDVTS
jgi:DNA-binding response OmpR family regulator